MYDELVFERLEDVDGEVYHVDFDLWTEEEGRSDLTLEVRLSKTTYDTWESQI